MIDFDPTEVFGYSTARFREQVKNNLSNNKEKMLIYTV